MRSTFQNEHCRLTQHCPTGTVKSRVKEVGVLIRVSMPGELPLDPTDSSDVAFLKDESTPAWLVRLACAVHAASASLSECSDLLAWFGVDRTRQAVWYWYQAYGESHDEAFTADPDRVAVDEKQVELEGGEKVWLYAAIDGDSKVVLHVQLSKHRGTDPVAEFLRTLTEKHRVSSDSTNFWVN